MSSADLLWTEYFEYDRRVDIVSVVEAWFTRAQGLPATVHHFERFPHLRHPDDNPARPDFTVLFTDKTALVGELSNLALAEGSLDDLAAQLLRYDSLKAIPAGPRHSQTQPVTMAKELDVVLFTPLEVANAACDRLAAALDDPKHPYKPRRPPMVLGHALDRDTYTFVRPTRAKNNLLPDYGRTPSLSSWLAQGSDTLRCAPQHFAPIKAQSRFMNDGPPSLYTATVIWSTLLPSYLAETDQLSPVDLDFTIEELVRRMRRDYGYGRTADVLEALELLRVARLAEEHGAGWRIFYRDLGGIEADISQALLHEYRSGSNKARPLRSARRREAAEEDESVPRQERLLPDQ
jgi:hypothetical protein